MSPLMLLVLMIFGAAVLAGAALVLSGRGGVTEPACGKCGYSVRGLEFLECPECGADLRAVGIVTPGTRRGGAFITAAVLWTVLVLLVSPLLWSVGRSMVGRSVVTQRRSIFIHDPVNLTAIATGTATIRGGNVGRTPVASDAVEVTLQEWPGAQLLYEPMTGAYSCTVPKLPSLRASSGYGPQGALATWLGAAAGMDTRTSMTVATALQKTIDETSTAAGGGFTRVTQPGLNIVAHPTFRFARPSSLPLLGAIVALPCIVVWLGGVFAIRRRTGATGRAMWSFTGAALVIAVAASMFFVLRGL